MSDTLTRDLVEKWRQDLFNLKERVKQKALDTQRALIIAQKIKDDNVNNLLIQPTSNILNAHIQLCSTLEQANNILRLYRVHDVPLTPATFNIFISLSPDLTTAYTYFDQIFDSDLRPNSYTFNALISKCLTFNQGQEMIKLMYRYKVMPNTQTYNTLLSLTTTDKIRKEILKEMEVQQVNINLVIYNTLISLSSDFAQALSFYNELKSRNIRPTINTFVTLLKKTNNQIEITEVERILKNENIRTNYSWERQIKMKKYKR